MTRIKTAKEHHDSRRSGRRAWTASCLSPAKSTAHAKRERPGKSADMDAKNRLTSKQRSRRWNAEAEEERRGKKKREEEGRMRILWESGTRCSFRSSRKRRTIRTRTRIGT